MKFLVILLSLLTMSVAVAAPKKLAKLPTYTPNNPYGKWTALPNGNNYLFCGDRIIYGSNFNEKIKIQYNGEDRSMTVREHCEMRRRELERAVATRTSEEPTLIQLQYEKIAGHLKKVPGGIKAGRMYSLKEIRKAMKAGELNNLRAANMMLPVLTEPEFSKLYAGETNNPQFTKTEHERYISNLITQNPAMLYTANGSLYYFSLNLSNDQLKLLASVVGSGGGGGGAGSSGGSGGRSGGSAGNSDSGSSRRPLANALEGARQNPFEGSKLSSNLNVKPQATTLPASFGVDSDATFVPYDMKMPSVSFGPTRGVASSGSSRGSSDRVKAVTVSSNPSLGMMNIGGMGRSNSGSGSSSGGGSSSKASGSGYQSYKSKAGASNDSSTSQSSATRGPNLNAVETVVGGGSINNLKIAGVSGPVGINLGTVEPVGCIECVDFENPNYTCNSNQWEQLLYQTNKGNFSIKDQAKPETQCLPFAEKQFSSSLFCGVGTDGLEYSANCVRKDDDRNSCYDQIMVDTGNICRQYFEIEEPFTHDDILLCAERLFVIACDKIPCTVEPKINQKDGKDVIGELTVKELNSDSFFTKTITGSGRYQKDIWVAKSYEEILNLPSLKREHKHQKVAAGSKIDLPDTNRNWLKDVAKDQFKDHLVKIGLFYQTEMNNKCKFETPKHYHFSGSQ